MSDREQELTLVINARDLASKVVDGFGGTLGKMAAGAEKAGSRVSRAFHSVSEGVVNGIGNLTETLAQGGGIGDAMFAFGAYMAGQAAEAMLGTFIERMAESSLLAAIGAPISAAFSALGGLMSSAIAIGMVAFPVILVAAIIAAVVFLANNPDVWNKIAEFAGKIPGAIADGLAALGRFLVDVFGKAWGLVVGAVGTYVGLVVDFWLKLPGRLFALPGLLADVFRNAFGAALDIARSIIGTVVSIVLGLIDKIKDAIHWLNVLAGNAPTKNVGNRPPKAPEGTGPYSTRTPSGGSMRLPSSSGVWLQGISERELVDMVERGLFFRLRRAAPTSARV